MFKFRMKNKQTNKQKKKKQHYTALMNYKISKAVST